MQVYPILQDREFGPEMIESMGAAFDAVLGDLGLVNRADPIVELVAKRIIQLAQLGERDADRLRERTVEVFNKLGAA